MDDVMARCATCNGLLDASEPPLPGIDALCECKGEGATDAEVWRYLAEEWDEADRQVFSGFMLEFERLFGHE